MRIAKSVVKTFSRLGRDGLIFAATPLTTSECSSAKRSLSLPRRERPRGKARTSRGRLAARILHGGELDRLIASGASFRAGDGAIRHRAVSPASAGGPLLTGCGKRSSGWPRLRVRERAVFDVLHRPLVREVDERLRHPRRGRPAPAPPLGRWLGWARSSNRPENSRTRWFERRRDLFTGAGRASTGRAASLGAHGGSPP